MRAKKLLWKTYVIFAVLVVLPMVIFGVYSSSLFRDSLTGVDKQSLAERTALIKEKLETSNWDSLDLQKFSRRYDNLGGARVTLILPDGKVVADSRENPEDMDNHADRPEVIEALDGKTGISQRYSFTLKEDFIYSAMPVYNNNGEIAFVLRSGYPMTFIQKEISGANSAILISVIFFSVIVLTTGFILLKNTFSPLDEIKKGAERFSGGNFEQKIFPPKEADLKTVAESLNFMAKQLDEKLDIIGEQSNLQQVVLQSMKEGILAVDYEERILLLNETASNILSISDVNAIGKTLQEVVRISEIQKFFKKVLSEGESQEAEIILQHGKDKFLQLSGTLLFDIDRKAIGALVVFNDITNLKHIDTVKKELVANVSHELRTPVTTIKGFIETLKEGAIEDPKNSERFLNIIEKHIGRLNMLIDDLLILSKLEESRDEIKLENEIIKPVLKSVVEDYEFKAGEKKIDIIIKCDDKLSAKINKHLMEQAIGNLLDNAIKYSDKKTQIEIGAYSKNDMICIYVEDEGYGIAEEHLPRLFERFYRIDKARSREEGGTGLGLAIVKHIVNTMNGMIDVESTPGKGSVFTIKILQN